MTNTISVPRELLEHIAGSLDKIALQSAFSVSDEIRALLSAPAVVVEGLEVVAYAIPIRSNGRRTSAYTEIIPFVPDLDVLVLGEVEPLCRLSDATAVIDQLRERVAELEESNRSWVLRIQQRDIEMDEMSQLIEAQAEELAAIMEQSTARAERILRLEDELAKLREGQEPVATVTIQHFRQDPRMENVDFQLQVTLPQGTHKLYAYPATKAVVMPERKELSIYADEEFHRWLEQLPDEVARLNGGKP